jgi:hypothetical protein
MANVGTGKNTHPRLILALDIGNRARKGPAAADVEGEGFKDKQGERFKEGERFKRPLTVGSDAPFRG